jgi:2-oxoglutarate ferredoxin oxidoreductase subunit beta
MLVSGASFIARGYTHGIEQLQKIFREAILHKGFSFVDVLQVCVSYFNLYEAYNKMTYEIQGNDTGSFEEVQKIIRSWNYDSLETPIPLGKFYETDAPRLDQAFLEFDPNLAERDAKIAAALEDFI